ncbi:MAG: YdeI/OmpD-associated family protein [Pseudomonadota bacterium]
MTGYFTHAFETRIDEFGVGKTRKVWYRVVFLPEDVAGELPFDRYPRLRVDAEIADVPVNGAFIPTGDGRRYLIVSPEVMKSAALQIGDPVTVVLRVADQDHVEIPEALAAALAVNAQANAIWQTLTPGKRRGLAHLVSSAKTQATREKRVAQALTAIIERDGRLR